MDIERYSTIMQIIEHKENDRHVERVLQVNKRTTAHIFSYYVTNLSKYMR